jgi:hypothetical protein
MQSPIVNVADVVADPEQVELLLQRLYTPPAADVALLNALGLIGFPASPPVAALSPLSLLLLLLHAAERNPLADAAGQAEKVERHCVEQSAPLHEVIGA